MTAKDLKTKLQKQGVYPEKVIKSKGQYRVLKGFFYRHGGNSQKWREKVTEALEKSNVVFTVTDSGEHN